MLPHDLLFDGPESAGLTVVLGHGAGATMDSPFMTAFAEGLAARGLRVARFEFPYMAARRADGRRRPPDRQPRLLECWQEVIQALAPAPLVIGGKSLGGRMASLIAADGEARDDRIRGLVCLGYPFHPPGKPERLRTEHLSGLRIPTLIVQGTRDALGTREEVEGYGLPRSIRFHWAPDGDHSLVPRKASGRSAEDNWAEAIDAIAKFLKEI
jgi:predicted alpha/beta-hydrolase family hydrolase